MGGMSYCPDLWTALPKGGALPSKQLSLLVFKLLLWPGLHLISLGSLHFALGNSSWRIVKKKEEQSKDSPNYLCLLVQCDKNGKCFKVFYLQAVT